MKIKSGFKDVVWSYVGTFLRFGSSLLVLPFILKTIPSEQLGIWYIFQTLNSLVALLDFGFSGTVVRNVAYSWAGVADLSHSGFSKGRKKKSNINLLWQIISVSRRVYLIISIIALLFSSSFGTIYLIKISSGIDMTYILTAWIIFLLGLFFNLYYSYWNAILSGLGLVKQFQQANVFSGLTYMIVALTGLSLGLGIVSLSLAFLLSGVVIRILCRYFFSIFAKHQNFSYNGYKKIPFSRKVFSALWFNAKKNGITALGSFLVLQFNAFFIPIFIDLKASAMYGLMIQVTRLISQFGNVPMVASFGELNCLRVENKKDLLRSKVSAFYVMGLFVLLSSAVGIFLFGNYFLVLINSKTMLPSGWLLFFFLVIMILEWSTTYFIGIISTENKIPFVRASIISGIAIISSGYILMRFFSMDLWSIVLSQILIQLCYNYWRWHKWVLRDLGLSFWGLYESGIANLRFILLKQLKMVLKK